MNNKRFLKSLTDNLNNEIIEVNHKDTFLLGDIKYTPIVQVPMGHEDSTMIFEIDNEVIVNFNDMKPSYEDITWISDNFDVTYLFKQFSGASWYPLLYDYDDKKMHELCKDKRLFKYEVILDMIKQIQKEVWNLNLEDKKKLEIIARCGEIEFRLTEGSDEFIQLEALLSKFSLKGYENE